MSSTQRSTMSRYGEDEVHNIKRRVGVAEWSAGAAAAVGPNLET